MLNILRLRQNFYGGSVSQLCTPGDLLRLRGYRACVGEVVLLQSERIVAVGGCSFCIDDCWLWRIFNKSRCCHVLLSSVATELTLLMRWRALEIQVLIFSSATNGCIESGYFFTLEEQVTLFLIICLICWFVFEAKNEQLYLLILQLF